ncbi:hypothetical protein ONZ43_g5080 [Nemania bipapillata]|uniref:Uncharacterized protein n=1 Tax=Nemania bipapillata TaxID=110536 RepID=A0ACC2IF08_9PEZI|nr:hypothetical protein ONZ43_g5080 [Nemania bipapillata]
MFSKALLTATLLGAASAHLPAMLRVFRPRKNIFSLGARAYVTKSPQPEVVRIQRVRFRRRMFRASTVLVSLGAAYLYYSILTRTLDILADEHGLTGEDSQEEEEEEDGDESPIFIPFPGFTKTVEPLPYRGTDPEWQAFIKLNSNTAVSNSIRKNLAEMARRLIVSHPVFAARHSKQAVVTKYWLDIFYPLKPPPTFVRQG